MVSGRQPGDRPEDPADPDLRLRTLRFEVLPDTYALFLEAEKQARLEAGHAVSDDEVIAWLCRSALRPGAAAETSAKPAYQVALTVCERCERCTQDGAGRVVDVSSAVVEMATCDAEMLGRVDGGVVAKVTRTLTEARRRQIWRRDHGRCTVPGCRSTSFLHIHHVIAQVDGGGHEAGNLTLLCGGHHRAAHDGRLQISGEAPGALSFRHGDGRPWSAPAPRVAELVVDATSALRHLGFGAGEAARAVDIARAHVGTSGSLDGVIRAALFELRPRRARP